MPNRHWAPWALLLLASCATSVAPAPATAPVAQDDDDDDAPAAAIAPPERAAPPLPSARPPEPRRPVPAEQTAAEPAKDHFADVGFKEVNEKDWLANLRAKIAQQEKVEPTDLRVSPGLLRAAFVRSSPVVTPTRPGRPTPPRRHEIVVVDNQGRRVAAFRPIAARGSDEPPKDLRFLAEERLVYEVVAPPPPAPAPAPVKRGAAKPVVRAKPGAKKLKQPTKPSKVKATRAPAPVAAPAQPPRTFVVQPIAPRARPIKCVGFHFTFSHEKDRLAYVTGTPRAADAASPPTAAFTQSSIAVDGAQVYPRRGRTTLASGPAWSRDGHSLAFLEAPASGPARLVLLAELDNPTGDTSWELPPGAAFEGASVFWAGAGKLVVGKTPMRPVFSASFSKE
jgi:hypothetical protein